MTSLLSGQQISPQPCSIGIVAPYNAGFMGMDGSPVKICSQQTTLQNTFSLPTPPPKDNTNKMCMIGMAVVLVVVIGVLLVKK